MKLTLFFPRCTFFRGLLLVSVLVVTMLSHGTQVEGQAKQSQGSEAKADKLLDEKDFEEGVRDEYPLGSELKTDPDMEIYLKRAKLFVENGRYDLAAIVWQRVLNESGETVMTRPQWTYRSYDRSYRKYKAVSEEIERSIAKLPAFGLKQYRLVADGEATAVLTAGVGEARQQALAKVDRQYFMSSLGDNAAFELACLRIDQHDFIGAARLLSRILDRHPDSDVPRSEVLLRLALANARLGDTATARKNLSDMVRTGGASAYGRVIAMISEEVEAGAVALRSTVDSAWPMAWGSPSRNGFMQSLPASVTANTLSELWSESFEVNSRGFADEPLHVQQLGDFVDRSFEHMYRREMQSFNAPVSREQLLEKWKANSWLPIGQMLLNDGNVYYKKYDRVVCRNADTGELQWMSRPCTYRIPAVSRWNSQMRRAFRLQAKNSDPATALETILFGDRLNQAMLISDGLLLTIDGPLEGYQDSDQQKTRPGGLDYMSVPRRVRSNYLSAYSLSTGKFKWFRPARNHAPDYDNKFEVGYMAAPVPFANFLLVPVCDNGSLWLHAIVKESGDLAWKTFLCEEPMSGSSPWSPVGMAIGGGDVYVGTGGGVVFAVDAMSGTVRWAVRYQRSTKSMMSEMARFGRTAQKLHRMDGFEEDLVIPHGRALMVVASDSDKLFALDRRTGEMIWEVPRRPVGDDAPGLYCLGVTDDAMFIAGKTFVRRYDLDKDGRIIWESRIDPSFGHGALTADAIYMPTGEAITKLDLKTGKIVAKVGVFSPTKEPVGNLFSDGKRLLTMGMARTYALQDLSLCLETLNQRIVAGDAEAQLHRMRLRLRGEEYDGALADLLAAAKIRTQQQGVASANRVLHDGLEELELVNRDPIKQISLIVDAQRKLDDAGSVSSIKAEELKQLTARRDRLLSASLEQICKQKISGALDDIFKVVAIVDRGDLIALARRACLETSQDTDADVLRAALLSENVNVRIVALAGTVRVLGKDAHELLIPLLEDKSDRVRLVAAIAMANLGERRALTIFGQLLDSDDLNVRSRTVQALRSVSGQRFRYAAYEKVEKRGDAAKRWRDWLASDGQKAELKLPIRNSRAVLGRTLFSLLRQNKVIELDAEHNVIWESNAIRQPWGVEGLPNGNRLICSYSRNFVVEFNSKGKEVWRMSGLSGNVAHAHRLNNGNTLITCSDASTVLEVTPEKKIVWKKTIKGRPQDARRLENGNTLIALHGSNKVIEINQEGRIVWEALRMRGAFSARRLSNGNTLIACSDGGKVVEVDHDKKIVWSISGLSSPFDAQRLENGNTLIADSGGCREVDAKKVLVWKKKMDGILRIHRY